MTLFLPSYSVSERASLLQSLAAHRGEHITFSFEHVGGIGGNLAGEPQGLGFDPTNSIVYTMSNNSGAREVKKVNLSGTTLATN